MKQLCVLLPMVIYLCTGCHKDRETPQSEQTDQTETDAYTQELEKEIARLAAENNRLRQIPQGKGSGHLAKGPSLTLSGNNNGSLLERLAVLEIELRNQEKRFEASEAALLTARQQARTTEEKLQETQIDLDLMLDERSKRKTANAEKRRAEEELAEVIVQREAINLLRLRAEKQLYALMNEIINAENKTGELQRLQTIAQNLASQVEPEDYNLEEQTQ